MVVIEIAPLRAPRSGATVSAEALAEAELERSERRAKRDYNIFSATAVRPERYLFSSIARSGGNSFSPLPLSLAATVGFDISFT